MSQEWFSYDCLKCDKSVVLDVRIDNNDEEPRRVICPVCGHLMDFRGRWPATRDGYGSRGDSPKEE